MLDDNYKLSDIQKNDYIVIIYDMRRIAKNQKYAFIKQELREDEKRLGIPYLTYLPDDISCNELYDKVFQIVTYDSIINFEEWIKNVKISMKCNKNSIDIPKSDVLINTLYVKDEYNIYISYSKELPLYNPLIKIKGPCIYLSSDELSIYDGFDVFSNSEVLDNDNKWECPKCKDRKQIKQTTYIQKFPKILIIHLKRFSVHGRNHTSKIKDLITFPIKNLNLSKYYQGNDEVPKYDLYGIVNHYGSLSYGHYIAYCKEWEKDKWYEYDDSNVVDINEKNIVTEGAYILFYKMK